VAWLYFDGDKDADLGANTHVRLTHTVILSTTFALTLALATSGAKSATQSFIADDLREIANPERGLYFHASSQSEQNPIQPWMTQQMQNNNMTLMLRLYYLKSFRDQPLSQTQLDLISNDFAAMRQAGVKTVLRFAYSEGIGEPDAPLNVVLGHMDQLAPIIAANSDVIATAQAGFIGAWGEWHSSTNNLTDPVNARQVVDKWMQVLPTNRTIQLRTPAQKWMVVQDTAALTAGEAFTGTDKSRIGHHNDCFLASDSDFGTYGNPAAEKAWLNLETQFVPMGGETCAVSSRSGSATARVEMEQLRFSYLNSGYHPDVLAGWEADGFMDEVKRKLGYRFELESIDYDPAALAGGQLSVSIDLVNTGWASPYNPRDVVLTLVSEDGLTEYDIPLPDDPRTWLPGGTINVSALVNVPVEAAAGNYQLLLSLPDPEATLADRPEYAIQLANPGLWDPATGRHDLGITIAIAGALDGDLDGDGFVGISDLNVVLAAWNQTVPPGDPLADPSGDGFVGIDDLNIVLGNWNAGTPPGDAGNIPEPGALVVMGVGSLILMKHRVHRRGGTG
jgi:Domain of unknown function (DUF4832)/Domain of unknown function (DUF4874)